MLERKIEKEIRSWIMDGDKALLVYGVRQAGRVRTVGMCGGSRIHLRRGINTAVSENDRIE